MTGVTSSMPLSFSDKTGKAVFAELSDTSDLCGAAGFSHLELRFAPY